MTVSGLRKPYWMDVRRRRAAWLPDFFPMQCESVMLVLK